jgi:hypothetical protein
MGCAARESVTAASDWVEFNILEVIANFDRK